MMMGTKHVRNSKLGFFLLLLIATTSATTFHVVNNCKSSIHVTVAQNGGDSNSLVAIPAPSPTPSHTPSPAPSPTPSRPKHTPSPAPSFLKVSPAPGPHRGDGHSSGRNSLRMPLIISGSAVFFLLFLCFVAFTYKRAKRRSRNTTAAQLLESMQPALLPQQFKYRELDIATNHFDSNLQLGQGGFGTVFKATLSDGTVVAVKKMQDTKHHGHGQFKAEVMSIGSIHHVNLVKLRGYSIHGDECLLVYEYMANGSLDKWLFNSENYLSWDKRFSIAMDIAQGLAYLHRGCNERILHLDIKPQNILLNEFFRAKISDFGLCRLIDSGKSHIMTLHMRGTPGYMAPDWLQSRVTDKTDVYSFGIVLLQIVSSKSVLEITTRTGSEVKLLSEFAFKMFQTGKLQELVDERLLNDGYNVNEMERLVCVGLSCIQEEPSLRPSMDTVVKMLEGVVQVFDSRDSLTAG